MRGCKDHARTGCSCCLRLLCRICPVYRSVSVCPASLNSWKDRPRTPIFGLFCTIKRGSGLASRPLGKFGVFVSTAVCQCVCACERVSFQGLPSTYSEYDIREGAQLQTNQEHDLDQQFMFPKSASMRWEETTRGYQEMGTWNKRHRLLLCTEVRTVLCFFYA